ncbi:MAG TPA: N-acetyltransferase [Micromonosporaceae bacterium]
MIVRPETPADRDVIHDLTAAAFARPGQAVAPEAPLIDDLRADDGYLPALSLVAVDETGNVIGHVMCTRAVVGGKPVLALGPLGVRPDRQRAGVGSALVHTVLGAADALGEPLVALLGSPDYYGRFGFRPSTDYGIVAPWGVNFQVRTLSGYGGGIAGEFRYARPFELMD